VASMKNQYTPDYVSPPGEMLKEALDERGMNQVDFARRIGMSRKHLKDILDGASPIVPDTALKFERVLGIPARFWNNREQQYRDFVAREAEAGRLKKRKDWLKYFKSLPVMRRYGWLPETKGPVETFRAILDFFGVASPDAWEAHWKDVEVHYRRSQAREPDLYALAAWLRRGEIEAQGIDCAPYDESGFRAALTKARRLTTEPPEVFQPRLIELCASCGAALVFVPELAKTASGATRWLSASKALIQLSLRYKTDDHLWFTFFHEAGHIVLHPKKDIFIEGKSADSEEEEQANRFAARMLIPEADYAAFVAGHRVLSGTAIQEFAQEQGIAPGILVGRLQHDGRVPFSHYNDLKRTFKWRSLQNGKEAS